jgi:hypothetical protein
MSKFHAGNVGAAISVGVFYNFDFSALKLSSHLT